MASDLVKAVNNAQPKVTAKEETVFNSVLKDMPADSANILPSYQSGDNFIPYGQTFTSQPKVFNDYMDTLAVKYGLIFVKAFLAQNPLSYFKRGTMPYGGKIESIVFDTIKPKMFRPDLIDGEDNPYAQNFGKVNGETYTHYQDIESSNTIVDTQDTMFFQNLEQFNQFCYGKVSQLVNGAILDEFFQTKLALAKSYADGMITTDSATDIKNLSQKILYWTKKLRYFNADSNAIGYTQATLVSDIVVIIPLKYSVMLDTDYFANVFNSELVQNKKVKYLEVDEFPDIWEYSKDHVVTQDDIDKGFIDKRNFPVGATVAKGTMAQPNATDATQSLKGDKIGALIMDRDALQLWDSLPLTLSTIANPKKRYVNLFINKKTGIMFVKALNSKVITADFS